MSHLTINGEQTILNLQKQFNSIFPYLKIEFFTEPHLTGQLSVRKKMIASTTRLSDIRNSRKDGNIEVDGMNTVSRFEEAFKDKFGLFVQVFRKSGSIWLETSATDNWTLEQQNEEGRSLQQHFNIEKEDPEAHDIY